MISFVFERIKSTEILKKIQYGKNKQRVKKHFFFTIASFKCHIGQKEINRDLNIHTDRLFSLIIVVKVPLVIGNVRGQVLITNYDIKSRKK